MKNNKILKRFLAFLLTAAMTLTYMPMAASWFAYAGDGDNDQVQLEQQVKAETSTGSEESSAAKGPSKEEVATDQTIESVEDAAESKESKTSEDTSEEVNGAASEKVEEASDKAKEEASDKAQEEAAEQVEETAEDEAAEAVAGELTAVEEGSYKITVKYDESAGIPEGAELEVKEIKSGGLKFWNYNRKAKKAVEGTDEMLDTDVTSNEELNRFFDISIVVDGKEIEPESAVEVNISYDDPINLSKGQELQVVHFADEGTEVITPNVDGEYIIFEQSSFSVTGTIVAGLNSSQNLVVIAEHNGNYYEVRYDGSLKSVEFDGTTLSTGDTVQIEMAERWSRSGNNNRLRVSNSGGYTYISPSATSGISGSQTNLTYSNNLLSTTVDGTAYYIGVNETATAITGRNTQDNAAKVYFATVPNPTGNTVDHIDIGIEATAKVSVPLAYGPYYDEDGNLLFTVSKENPIDGTGFNNNIPITQQDLMGSTVSSYTQSASGLRTPLNNFLITSFTTSTGSGQAIDQVRYNGTFPVGTSASSADKVYYNVDVTKPVDLTLTYDYDGDGDDDILYDMDGEPLVVSVVTSLDASFDYWDDRNECPGILNSWEVGRWRNGEFVTGNGGGMDFRLGASSESQADLAAIEIVKYIVDEDGNTIELPSDANYVFDFDIYQNPNGDVTAPTAWSGETTASVDYNGYTSNDNRTVTVGSSGIGLAYDYDVVDGLTYIEEVAADVPQEITDADGNTLKYVDTYIETEYAWRNDSGELHSNIKQTDTMSAIPDVVGDYYSTTYDEDQDGNPDTLHNTFLEFYVYNVYAPETGSVEVKKVFSGVDALPEGFQITNDYNSDVFTVSNATSGTGTAADPYVWTISDVPTGTEVTFTESGADIDGYTLTATSDPTGGKSAAVVKDETQTVTLTNTYELITTEASVKKVWDDNNNADGKRPESLKVTLSNGDEVTLNEENGWSAKVENLPKYKDGKEINYTWSESSLPEGYTLVSSTKDGTVTTLTNKYTAPDKGVASINPPVQKIIEGKAPKKAETYTFKLEATNPSNPMPKAAGGSSSMTMNIKGEGIKEFGKIEFTEPGVYAYIVSEVMGDNEDCEYDDTIYTVIATVTEGSDGKLQVTREYKKDGASVSTATFQFVNTYDGEDESSGAKTGDDSGIMGLLALMSASAAGLAALCVRRRREEQ